jgi:hypothetical protein
VVYSELPTPETGGHGCLISSPHSVVGGSKSAATGSAGFSYKLPDFKELNLLSHLVETKVSAMCFLLQIIY